MFVTSVIFSSGILDVSSRSLFSPPFYLDATTAVFIDPSKIIKDYLADPAYRIGNNLQVSVNVTDAVDLFSYQVNVTWNPSMLNFLRVVSYGDFLARTGSSYGTSRIQPTWKASNVTGYASIAETILGDVAGISGGGRLFTIEFRIVGYGWTDLNIGSGGSLPTMLLNSAGGTITYNTVRGYFSNRLGGDVDSDRDVDYNDFVVLAGAYGSTSGQPAYKRNADFDDDGDVDYNDFVKLAGNYGKVAPP